MTKDLLFEIGVEEIPARFLPSAIKQIKALAAENLAEAGLVYQQINSYATPRRLVLLVEALAEKAVDTQTEVRGPATAAAFDGEGQPTPALAGFCRGQGLQADELFEREVKGKTYLFGLKKSQGQETADLLPSILLKTAEKISFPKPMRWGYGSLRFARPIHWLVALFGADVIELEFAGLKADRFSRGHRLLGSDKIDISEPATYLQALRDNYVIVDQNERQQMIVESINAVAAEIKGRVAEDAQLLTEVTYLLEYPTALCGKFEEKYLDIPEELITTPMVDQQRYFPVYGADGKLLPRFITVRNGDGRFLDIVAAGNEKVLRARLADAEFFYQEDLRDQMADKVEELSEVVFHDKLGSLRQKVGRIILLAEHIADLLGYDQQERQDTSRAAYLAKADLSSRVVYEFPELQGIIGEYYALSAGENATVAQAIREHYLPRFAGDDLPESKPGMAVALADKLDSIAGFFSMGIIPSGSQDPYALRRAAAGCAAIIIRNQLPLQLSSLLPYALQLITEDATAPPEMDQAAAAAKIIAFLNQRLENILAEQGISYDIINAVQQSPAADIGYLTGYSGIAQALQKYRRSESFPLFLAAVTRIANILRSADSGEELQIQPQLFADPSEAQLLAAVEKVEPAIYAAWEDRDYAAILHKIAEIAPAIHAFFEAVMVMDEDLAIRANRRALLRRILRLADKIGDFTKIVE